MTVRRKCIGLYEIIQKRFGQVGTGLEMAQAFEMKDMYVSYKMNLSKNLS